MSWGEAGRASGFTFPPGSVALLGSAGVEAQAADGHVDVSVFGPDGDPFSEAAFSVGEKSAGGHLVVEESGFPEDVAHGAGAIVAAVIEDGVSASELVGKALEVVSGCDGAFDCRGCVGWGDGPVADEAHEIPLVIREWRVGFCGGDRSRTGLGGVERNGGGRRGVVLVLPRHVFAETGPGRSPSAVDGARAQEEN